MTRLPLLIPIALLALLPVGCAPADVAGDYTVAITNGPNACEFANWTEGDSTAGIPVVVLQDADQVQVDVRGATAVLLELALGASVFDGQVSGNRITAALIGDRAQSMGSCTYTTRVDLDATIHGDVIEGTLHWRPMTNGHPDCGVLDTCDSNRQSFNGTRPPSGG